MKVTYAPDIPESVLVVVRSCVEAYRFLLPRWCSELTVLWCDRADGSGTAAEMATFEEYRFIQLILYPDFVVSAIRDQRKYLRHEFFHPILQPTKKVQSELIEALDLENENPSLGRWAMNLIREANEKAIQDLTDAFDVPRSALEEEARRVVQRLMSLNLQDDPDAREIAIDLVANAIERRNTLCA